MVHCWSDHPPLIDASLDCCLDFLSCLPGHDSHIKMTAIYEVELEEIPAFSILIHSPSYLVSQYLQTSIPPSSTNIAYCLMRIAIDTSLAPDAELPALTPSASPATPSSELFPAISYPLGLLQRLSMTPLRPISLGDSIVEGPIRGPQPGEETIPSTSPSLRSTKGILFQPPTEEQHRDVLRLGFMSLPSSF